MRVADEQRELDGVTELTHGLRLAPPGKANVYGLAFLLGAVAGIAQVTLPDPTDGWDGLILALAAFATACGLARRNGSSATGIIGAGLLSCLGVFVGVLAVAVFFVIWFLVASVD